VWHDPYRATLRFDDFFEPQASGIYFLLANTQAIGTETEPEFTLRDVLQMLRDGFCQMVFKIVPICRRQGREHLGQLDAAAQPAERNAGRVNIQQGSTALQGGEFFCAVQALEFGQTERWLAAENK